MEKEESPTDIGKQSYLTAKEVIGILDIKPQTLYAYVSRGWVRTIGQQGTRVKLYVREDVEKLLARSQARAGHGPNAAAALRWGEPVINSAITELTPLGPRYRGILATELARMECAFEATADLLWSGLWNEKTAFWPSNRPGLEFVRLARPYFQKKSVDLIQGRLAILVQFLSEIQEGNPELALGSMLAAGRQIIHVVAGAFGMLCGKPLVLANSDEAVADLLMRAMDLSAEDRIRCGLNVALTLAADHELAVPTFTARVAASTGANLNACVMTGLVTFDGPLTGNRGNGIEELVLICKTKADLKESVLRAHKQGRQLGGFNHPMYPAGDVRAQVLIEYARSLPAIPANAHALLETLEEVARDYHLMPSFPAGLVALQLALGLPARCGSTLFFLGRIAGLVAHVQEQRMAAFLIRPRARYVG